MIAEDSIDDILAKDLNYDAFPIQSGYGIKTDLQYAVYQPTRWGKRDEKEQQGNYIVISLHKRV